MLPDRDSERERAELLNPSPNAIGHQPRRRYAAAAATCASAPAGQRRHTATLPVLRALRALQPCNLARPSETQRNPTCGRYIYFIPQNPPHLSLVIPTSLATSTPSPHNLSRDGASRIHITLPLSRLAIASAVLVSSSLDPPSHSRHINHPTMAPGGYPCPEPGCGKSFSSSSE